MASLIFSERFILGKDFISPAICGDEICGEMRFQVLGGELWPFLSCHYIICATKIKMIPCRFSKQSSTHTFLCCYFGEIEFYLDNKTFTLHKLIFSYNDSKKYMLMSSDYF